MHADRGRIVAEGDTTNSDSSQDERLMTSEQMPGSIDEFITMVIAENSALKDECLTLRSELRAALDRVVDAQASYRTPVNRTPDPAPAASDHRIRMIKFRNWGIKLAKDKRVLKARISALREENSALRDQTRVLEDSVANLEAQCFDLLNSRRYRLGSAFARAIKVPRPGQIGLSPSGRSGVEPELDDAETS